MTKTATEMAHIGHIASEDLDARKRDNALVHLAKELGDKYFALAIQRKGLSVLVDETIDQLAHIPDARDANGLVVVGKLDLVKLGLTQAEAVARKADLRLPLSTHEWNTLALQVVGAGDDVADKLGSHTARLGERTGWRK